MMALVAARMQAPVVLLTLDPEDPAMPDRVVLHIQVPVVPRIPAPVVRCIQDPVVPHMTDRVVTHIQVPVALAMRVRAVPAMRVPVAAKTARAFADNNRNFHFAESRTPLPSLNRVGLGEIYREGEGNSPR